jgi:ribosome-binding protein aMBF1 (putative translation factor)
MSYATAIRDHLEAQRREHPPGVCEICGNETTGVDITVCNECVVFEKRLEYFLQRNQAAAVARSLREGF